MTSNTSAMNRVDKLTSDNSRLQEMCNHQRKQIEDQRDQINSLQHNLKLGNGNRVNISCSVSSTPVKISTNGSCSYCIEIKFH